MNALEQHFELLNEVAIREQHFDMLSNKITFKLEWIDGDYSKWHDLIFHNVSCFYFVNKHTDFYFVNKHTEDRKEIWEPKEGYFLELTTIDDYSMDETLKLTLHSEYSEWLNDYNGGANIVMEIWSGLLVVEAKSVQIDNTTYDLY